MPTLKDEIEIILSQERKGLHVNTIADRVIARRQIDFTSKETLVRNISAICSRIDRSRDGAIVRIKNRDGTNKRGWYRLKVPRTPRPPRLGQIKISPLSQEIPEITSTMLGKAGEYAVISQLLLNGYIANIMSVDDGIDIIASKDSKVFFIQVKTATISDQNLRCSFSVKKSAFQKGHAMDVRYILVTRYADNRFLFFKFTEGEISKYIHDCLIDETPSSIRIKIRFKDGINAFIYRNDKEAELGYHLGNFDL